MFLRTTGTVSVGNSLSYPLHKKGPKDEPSNYHRPISLTSVVPCKMLEHVALHHLNKSLDPVLYNRQHGFSRGLSCETQLHSIYHNLVRTAEQSPRAHAVMLDFRKAFDKVPHLLLMQKIRWFQGIEPQLVNWVHKTSSLTGVKWLLWGTAAHHRSLLHLVFPRDISVLFILSPKPQTPARL